MAVGVIGCGKMGLKHIGVLRLIGENVLAFDEKEEARRKAEAIEGVLIANSLDEIFEGNLVDAVIIATPTPTHFEMIDRSIEAGLDFLCEKPLVETSIEAGNILDKAIGLGVKGMIGFTYRHCDLYRRLHNLLDNDLLGVVRYAHFRMGTPGDHQEWKHNQELGGGAINEILSHLVDLSIWLFGPAFSKKVVDSKIVRSHRKINYLECKPTAEDWVITSFNTFLCPQILCTADLATNTFMHTCEIQGSNGYAWLNISNINTFRGLQIKLDTVDFASEYAAGWHKIHVDGDNFLHKEIVDFLNYSRKNTKPIGCTIQEYVHLANVLEEIHHDKPNNTNGKIAYR